MKPTGGSAMPAMAPVPPIKNPADRVIPRILPSEPPSSAESHPPPHPPPPPRMHEVRLPSSPPPIKLQKAEARPTGRAGAPQAAGAAKTQIEFLPWSQLSGAQRMGRIGLVALGIVVIFFVIRGVTAYLHPGGVVVKPTIQQTEQPKQALLTPEDRKDGVRSLCKVFNIYGMPKSASDAAEDATNAGELFKLAGNQSPGRSAFILTTLAQEFQAGKLGASDCSAAGTPLDSSDANVPFGSSGAAARH